MANRARGLLRRAAKGTTWSQFLDYASPALFEVMPFRALIAQGREFMSNGSDATRFSEAQAQIAKSLHARGVDVVVGKPASDGDARALTELDEHARREAGQRILEIYFAQIFAGEHTILDLRPEAFSASETGALQWAPRAFYVQWQEDFLTGLRDLYGGFYLDDDARFARGLEQLRLEATGDALVRHLGSGDQRAVRFDTSAFHETFHQTFMKCREEGVSLHRNFLALGVYLVCLYDVLEALDLEFDVRGAFERVHA